MQSVAGLRLGVRILRRAQSHLRASLRNCTPAQHTTTRHAMLLIAATLERFPRRV